MTAPIDFAADVSRLLAAHRERVAKGKGPRKLSGTEIAAMRLALGILRDPDIGPWSSVDLAIDTLHLGGAPGGLLDVLADTLAIASHRSDLPMGGGVAAARIARYRRRLLIARAALYLRAVLRAERGDCGPSAMICTRCDRERGHAHCACCAPSGTCTCWGAWRLGYRRITPLWQAPGVRGAR